MTIAEASETGTPTPSAADTGGDERISHRGPMRRWLISPEIGALIGAVVVWVFLWGNGETFGTAGTTLNWLDVAAPYGVMATAVALLMIGGEFDLSSGVITGGTAMIIGLTSRFFTGTGVHIGWAILAAFAGAAAVGWFNGYMVNKTGLPSFIITLASFFVVQGLMLVLSKRLAQKVYVDQIKEQRGAVGFKKWVAQEWRFTDFPFRDPIFLGLVIIGMALFVYGLLDQSFVRRSGMSMVGAIAAVVGLAVSAGGFALLHRTDGVSNNLTLGSLAAVGLIVLVVGLALTRWRQSSGVRLSSPLPRKAIAQVGLGILGVALACLVQIPFDRGERRAVLTWISPGLRPVVAILAALVGIVLAARALFPSIRDRVRASGFVRIALFSMYAGLMVMILVISALQLTTVQALRAITLVLFGAAGIGLLLSARAQAAKVNKTAQLAIGVLAGVGLVLIGLVVRTDSSATRFRTVLPAAAVIAAAFLIANSVLEFVMEKRSAADSKADRLGRILQIVGGSLMAIGVAIRLVFTNFTEAQAVALREAGEPVPQNVLRETVMWWFLVAAVGAFVLAKTKWGNWIFAVGGNKDAARAIGVPANRVKIGLFVVVALCGALAGTLIALRYGTVQANQGVGLEFEYIIAAVVGGCLMTGGYGSVIGASLGAAILAMSTTGFQTVSGWNSDGRFAFLGGVLLVAVLMNTYTRKKAMEAR